MLGLDEIEEEYELSLGSDESQRCPNIWLDDKYLPGLKATAQEFMAEGKTSPPLLSCSLRNTVDLDLMG